MDFEKAKSRGRYDLSIDCEYRHEGNPSFCGLISGVRFAAYYWEIPNDFRYTGALVDMPIQEAYCPRRIAYTTPQRQSQN